MSSGYGRSSTSGGNATGHNGGRRGPKKFGKNLTKLTKPPSAPNAPPVPGITATGNKSSTASSSGGGGLLLLSKTKPGGGSGLLGTSSTLSSLGGKDSSAANIATTVGSALPNVSAHDASLLSAQGNAAAAANASANNSGGEQVGGSGKSAPPPAWGSKSGEKPQQSQSMQQLQGQERGVVSSMEKLSLQLPNVVKPPIQQQWMGGDERITPRNDVKPPPGLLTPRRSMANQNMPNDVSAIDSSARSANSNTDLSIPKQQLSSPQLASSAVAAEVDNHPKDEQLSFMSKLAKERAEKLKSEEEARMLKQKERAATRLRELEAKRLEQTKEKERVQLAKDQHKEQHQRLQQQQHRGPPTSVIIGKEVSLKKLPSPNQPKVPSKIYSRKEVSQPSSQIILEPLGKPKKIMAKSAKEKEVAEKTLLEKKKFYDPNKTFSSLVGGKQQQQQQQQQSSQQPNTVKQNNTVGAGAGSVKSAKSEETGGSKNSASHNTPASRDKSTSSKGKMTEEVSQPPPFRMVNLDSFEDRGTSRGTYAAGGAGARMLFDPNSGNLVTAKGEAKKAKQQQQHMMQQLQNKGRKDFDFEAIQKTGDFPKLLSRPADSGDESTRQRGKKDTRKEEQTQQKKSGRSPKTAKAPRMPRTRGVLFKLDEHGNYANADECEADQGYGQHSVPGGRVKNAAEYAKLMEQKQKLEQQLLGQHHQKETGEEYDDQMIDNNAPGGFSGFRNDPSFIQYQQQTDFEAQQQRILEDAWSSLVEAEPSRDEVNDEDEVEEEHHLPFSSKRGVDKSEDEYAAALDFSPVCVVCCQC